MNRTNWAASTLAVLLAATLGSGCGSSGGPTGPGGGAANQVTISGFSFSALSVPVGTTVTWKNADSATHTATADSVSAFQFDTGDIAAGATSRGVTFSQAGSFSYHCTYHSSMKATITVQ
jgi:plastocyanin